MQRSGFRPTVCAVSQQKYRPGLANRAAKVVSLIAWALACSAAVAAAEGPAEATQPPADTVATAPATVVSAAVSPPVSAPVSARQAAWADGLSTVLAVSQGAVERNPLIVPSPAGLLAVTGVKLGLVEWVERSSMPPQQRQSTLQALAAMWGGASINNVLVLLSAQPAVAVLAGVAGGLWMWHARSPQMPTEAPLATPPGVAPDTVAAQVSLPNTSRE
jgi:hypothetical protein